MQVCFECTYCGHKWEDFVRYGYDMEPKCPHCGDKKIKAKEKKTTVIDAYVGVEAPTHNTQYGASYDDDDDDYRGMD